MVITVVVITRSSGIYTREARHKLFGDVCGARERTAPDPRRTSTITRIRIAADRGSLSLFISLCFSLFLSLSLRAETQTQFAVVSFYFPLNLNYLFIRIIIACFLTLPECPSDVKFFLRKTDDIETL